MDYHKLITKLLLIFLPSTLFVLSCSSQPQQKQKDEAAIDQNSHAILLQKLFVISNSAKNDTLKAAMIKHLLDSADVSIEELKSTQQHFENNSAYWIDVYSKIKGVLKERKSDKKVNEKGS